MHLKRAHHVAVIGAGLAGASCARALAQAGHTVHLFDKSRGPGGRMATRRLAWTGAEGAAHTCALDHGAVALTGCSSVFQTFLHETAQASLLVPWQPRLAAHSLALEHPGPHWLPTPDGPALCRHLVQGLPATWSFTVDSLHRSSDGWHLHAGEQVHPAAFDTVVLALPPAQAAPLLQPHHSDWARQAAAASMQPCWTLMGVAATDTLDPHAPSPVWDVWRPASGPLAWLLRNDARPGRKTVPGQAHWVAHAQPAWSRQHLEEPAEAVQQQLQAAVAEVLGHPVAWLHSSAHRWRYALPPTHLAPQPPTDARWWQAAAGLGVCGDFLGGQGLEGAWLSAQALAADIVASRHHRPAPAAAPQVGLPDSTHTGWLP